jgi:phage terminase small subunit
MTRHKPPAHLRPATARWWIAVQKDFDLEPHHVRLLTLAATAWDRADSAREVIQTEGAVFRDRFDQPKARPEVAIERDATIAFARLLRELDLDLDPPAAPGRPPVLRSNNRGA